METFKQKVNVTTEERFRLVFLILRIGGFPVHMESVPIYIKVYNTIMVFSSYPLYFSMIMDFYVHIDELQLAMKSLRIVLTTTIVLWVDFNLRFIIRRSMNHLIRLTESFIWEDMPKKDPGTGQLTMAGLIPYLQVIIRNVLVFSSTFHFIQSGIRIFTAHEMVFSSWYPFDFSASPIYEMINITQMLASIQYQSIYFGFVLLNTMFVCVACTQLEKLGNKLSNIKQNSVKNLNHFSDLSFTNVREQTKGNEHEKYGQQSALNECIQLHQQIIEFIRSLENVMNFTLGGIFLFLLIAMCFDAFSAVTSWGDFADLAQALYIYFVMIGCTYVFCNLGTQLANHVEQVKEAAWSCDWVGAPISFQRCLISIIAMTNKGFTLTAGKFVPVSNVTLLNMMNETMSFFMFLMAMKDKKEITKV